MSKESKERIKQKKKERQKALLQEVENKEEPETLEKTVENEAPTNSEKQTQNENIEVLEIFPRKKHKAKFLAQGTAVIKMHDMGLKIKNIRYTINQEGHCHVQPPFQYYPMPGDEIDAYVPTIKFDDKSIWKNATKVTAEAILKHHEKVLAKVKEPQEKQPS